MSHCRVTAEQLDQDCVSQFLDFHLPSCDCHSAAPRTHGDLSSALGHLLAVLRDQRVIAQPVLSTGPIADELSRYDKHMRDARGLAEGTRCCGIWASKPAARTRCAIPLPLCGWHRVKLRNGLSANWGIPAPRCCFGCISSSVERLISFHTPTDIKRQRVSDLQACCASNYPVSTQTAF